MSMWLDVVVMSEKAFAAVKEDEELLGSVYQQEKDALKKLGIAKSDLSGCDYRSIDDAVTAMNEATGEDGEADFQEEGSLEYEGTYGPAMFWSPKTFAKALEDSSGWQMAVEMEPEIKALAKRAVKEKLWVIAVVN
jgi:hypothetical protein